MEKVNYIYGPIKSRRLGLSLGIDLTPGKTCSFDCIYCQAGKTRMRTIERRVYADHELVFGQLRVWLKEHADIAQGLKYVTIAGNGEPTLHSGLGEIISGIKKIIPLPVAVITNSSLLASATLRRELRQADLVVPSLDAAKQDIFEKIDRPAAGINVDDILKALIDFRKEYKGKIWLEIMLVRGLNDSPGHLAALKKAVELIKPDKVQLNSPVRHTAEEGVLSLERNELEAIAREFGPLAEIV